LYGIDGGRLQYDGEMVTVLVEGDDSLLEDGIALLCRYQLWIENLDLLELILSAWRNVFPYLINHHHYGYVAAFSNIRKIVQRYES
jgi:hypothetical protein